MSFIRTTEMPSVYRHLEKMSIEELLNYINDEDASIAAVICGLVPRIAGLVDAAASHMEQGGRLFYIGAGTSGRLGVLDASECPPTYGVSADVVIGIMAGGDEALRFGIEDAEDSHEQGWVDLEKYNINNQDILIGIAASGTTPYVLGALKKAQEQGILTACIVCNADSPIAEYADFPIEAVVGPEFVTGSTRMKSGTAQKLILNMISTTVMIRLGKVQDNRMVNMQISNEKLVERGVKMLMEKTGITDYAQAKASLLKYGNVKIAMEKLKM
ncbi:N-acetylmuramic acid 6-phosphate etherase [Pedobacter sp. ok626]|uniref:N-acetylmuramic acid 6-phosphate etherase n=1 Tax=Pedobacter sp. ok626 TaxID=1761882 RepID=UPI000B852732|nr:N-acetylmuramic acid 6-phosphate etherase [Pedobacter sp. ok626]